MGFRKNVYQSCLAGASWLLRVSENGRGYDQVNNKNLRPWMGWMTVILLSLLLAQVYMGSAREERIPYSQFKQMLKDKRIVNLQMSTDMFHGKYRTPTGQERDFHVLPIPDPNLVSDLEHYGVTNYEGA